MTKKQYKWARIITIILIAFTISTSLSLNNYIIPILVIFAGMAFMFSIRKKYEKEEGVLADERDYKIAGNAARYTLFVYSIIGVVATMILMVLGKENDTLLTIGYFASYTVCGLMLLNAILFKILSKRSNEK